MHIINGPSRQNCARPFTQDFSKTELTRPEYAPYALLASTEQDSLSAAFQKSG